MPSPQDSHSLPFKPFAFPYGVTILSQLPGIANYCESTPEKGMA